MTTEVWRPITVPGVSHLYEVSNLGELRNTRTHRNMKGKFDKDGYT